VRSRAPSGTQSTPGLRIEWAEPGAISLQRPSRSINSRRIGVAASRTEFRSDADSSRSRIGGISMPLTPKRVHLSQHRVWRLLRVVCRTPISRTRVTLFRMGDLMRTCLLSANHELSFRVRSESFVLYLSLPRRFHVRDLMRTDPKSCKVTRTAYCSGKCVHCRGKTSLSSRSTCRSAMMGLGS
jgi:hypothetical protein